MLEVFMDNSFFQGLVQHWDYLDDELTPPNFEEHIDYFTMFLDSGRGARLAIERTQRLKRLLDKPNPELIALINIAYELDVWGQSVPEWEQVNFLFRLILTSWQDMGLSPADFQDERSALMGGI